MSTSVKIDEKDKEKLEKLQALVILKAGRKMTQQEILSSLIRDAYARSSEFVEKLSNAGTTMSDEEYEKVYSLVEDWGVETSWEEIDQILYGAKTRVKR